MDPFYVLDKANSIAILNEDCDLIGHDPVIFVHDMWAIRRPGQTQEHGFRIHLGLLREEDKVLAALQMFARFIARVRLSGDLQTQVRRELRKDGIDGAIKIISGGKTLNRLIE